MKYYNYLGRACGLTPTFEEYKYLYFWMPM